MANKKILKFLLVISIIIIWSSGNASAGTAEFSFSLKDYTPYGIDLNVNSVGTITAQATWTGTAPYLRLILFGPDGNEIIRKQDYSPTLLTYIVTPEDLRKGTGRWTIVAQNFFQNTTVSGTVTIEYPTVGSIYVTSTPSGASIYLDGSNTGKITPSTLTNVPTGTHTVTCKLFGYSDNETGVTVASGSIANITCTLNPIKVGTELLQIMGVILILAGLLFTALTTIKKDITIEVGITERSLKYIGGAGVMLIIIGAYILLKSFERL